MNLLLYFAILLLPVSRAEVPYTNYVEGILQKFLNGPGLVTLAGVKPFTSIDHANELRNILRSFRKQGLIRNKDLGWFDDGTFYEPGNLKPHDFLIVYNRTATNLLLQKPEVRSVLDRHGFAHVRDITTAIRAYQNKRNGILVGILFGYPPVEVETFGLHESLGLAWEQDQRQPTGFLSSTDFSYGSFMKFTSQSDEHIREIQKLTRDAVEKYHRLSIQSHWATDVINKWPVSDCTSRLTGVPQ